MQINDGTGGGHSAKVTGDGRVAVNADDGCLAAAKAGLLYSMGNDSGNPSVTATSGGGIVMYLSNSLQAKKSLVIDSILVSSSAAGMLCSIVTGLTEGTIGVNLSIDAFSTNTGYPIGHSAGYSAHVWTEDSGDGMTGLTGGTYALTTQLPAGNPVELVPSGRFIVAPGGNIAVFAKNAGEFTSAIRFYEIDEATGY
jgi:hypothetical protein